MSQLEKYLEKRNRSEPDSYDMEAYRFVMEGLQYTAAGLKAKRHITGAELLEGLRRYGLEHYGRLARTVLNHWGVRKTADFGKIVFELVEAGILRKQPEDKIEDFTNAYDFTDAFDKAFRMEEEIREHRKPNG